MMVSNCGQCCPVLSKLPSFVGVRKKCEPDPIYSLFLCNTGFPCYTLRMPWSWSIYLDRVYKPHVQDFLAPYEWMPHALELEVDTFLSHGSCYVYTLLVGPKSICCSLYCFLELKSTSSIFVYVHF
ncbi:hypothetical protein KP509_11G092900 [Ceratopteris richardii]|uniref:Uncharacterized protein n=1 Tax=Ceratopteris richardii TaxID=49495 RepID=A0A8T2TX84_CERRI|nr:hypothetical protein KP509_11G092900 [Ceratopteris richardii]